MRMWSSFSEAAAGVQIEQRNSDVSATSVWHVLVFFFFFLQYFGGIQGVTMRRYANNLETVLAPKGKYKMNTKQRDGNIRMALPGLVRLNYKLLEKLTYVKK